MHSVEQNFINQLVIRKGTALKLTKNCVSPSWFGIYFKVNSSSLYGVLCSRICPTKTSGVFRMVIFEVMCKNVSESVTEPLKIVQ